LYDISFKALFPVLALTLIHKQITRKHSALKKKKGGLVY
jgi:hypothetical protein